MAKEIKKSKHTTKDGIFYYSVRYRDTNGILKQKYHQDKSWRSHKEAIEASKEFLRNVKAVDEDLTMDGLFDLYIADSEKRNKPSTIISYNNLYASKIKPTFGSVPVHKITSRQIAQWQVTMLEKGLENSTITTIQTVFRLFLNFAVRNDLIDKSPFKARTVTNKNKHKREMLFWTPDEFKRFIKCVDKPILKTFFKTLYWSGIRRGEACALTIGDIDFVNNVININKTYDPRTQTSGSPKNYGSNRSVEMTSELANDLRIVVDSLMTMPGILKTDPVFYGSHRISPSTFELARDKACAESGVKRIRIHDFRHSHVSLLINNRFTSFEIAKRLGHSPKMVEEVYGHLFKDGQRAMVTRLNEIALEPEESKTENALKN